MTEPITDQLGSGELLDSGQRKLEWARQHMPIMAALREDFAAEQPFAGERIGMAMHVEAKTAILTELLAIGGAEVAITGCNPLSTHDDVSVALDAIDGVTSYARRGVDDDEYYDAIEAVIAHEPTITIDDGGDLVFAIHEDYPELIDGIIGYSRAPSWAIARRRWTPVVVSSQPPMMPSISSGCSSWIANTRSPPSSMVIVGSWAITASMAS